MNFKVIVTKKFSFCFTKHIKIAFILDIKKGLLFLRCDFFQKNKVNHFNIYVLLIA